LRDNQLVQQQPDPKPFTPTIVQIVPEQAAKEIGMADVAVASFGLTGFIMAAALVAGLVAGVVYIWFRSTRAVSTIEARGHQHNLFRA
jgi:uncharacterized membrane-anchored protein